MNLPEPFQHTATDTLRFNRLKEDGGNTDPEERGGGGMHTYCHERTE